jgi:hypothetical protein
VRGRGGFAQNEELETAHAAGAATTELPVPDFRAAIVTGSTSGIGLAVARALAEAGHKRLGQRTTRDRPTRAA